MFAYSFFIIHFSQEIRFLYFKLKLTLKTKSEQNLDVFLGLLTENKKKGEHGSLWNAKGSDSSRNKIDQNTATITFVLF